MAENQLEMSASEALFGFIGWLTSLEEPIVASARHDAGVFADLVGEFCKWHNLAEPRDDWAENLRYPAHLGFWNSSAPDFYEASSDVDEALDNG